MSKSMLAIAAAAIACLALNAAADPAQNVQPREPRVWPRLERFESEQAFRDYLRRTRALARERGLRWSSLGGVQLAQSEDLCPDGTPPPCASDAGDDNIVVTGMRASMSSAQASRSSNTSSSITNVQTQGVDEGDIVKQIGRFLIVLQDGRLFVADTRPNGQPGLALVGRTNVYRERRYGAWYDEMLVTHNRILVTAYSYQQSASELSVFAFDAETGAVRREAIYYLSSNDYYDTENYATRLVNGNLVIYTPLFLGYMDEDAPMRWPLVRRWLRDGRERTELSKGTPLFDARDIYKPVQTTLLPTVHSISVCPLGSLRAGDELECNTTAFVGGGQREFFVSTTDVFLWVTPGWGERERGVTTCSEPINATVFRVPLSGAAPTAMHAQGEPLDQFALDGDENEFRALLAWNTRSGCEDDAAAQVRYLHAPLSQFRNAPPRPRARDYVAAPSPRTRLFETRFTGDYVVYGARSTWYSAPYYDSRPRANARVVALPLARPSAATILETPHDVMRVERVGNDIAMTGYRDDTGLSLSLIDLSARPRVADTRVLEGQFESEGRSHAFNSLVDEDGAGLMGIPTVRREGEAGRYVWRSAGSDVSFLSVDAAGRLGALGDLSRSESALHASYRCEVSCIDWYGNSRPIFTDGRIFALTGTELIEGDVRAGAITETRRLNLSAPPPQ